MASSYDSLPGNEVELLKRDMLTVLRYEPLVMCHTIAPNDSATYSCDTPIKCNALPFHLLTKR
jgi:hypothetical protein